MRIQHGEQLPVKWRHDAYERSQQHAHDLQKEAHHVEEAERHHEFLLDAEAQRRHHDVVEVRVAHGRGVVGREVELSSD